jgi:hypothetical protein
MKEEQAFIKSLSSRTGGMADMTAFTGNDPDFLALSSAIGTPYTRHLKYMLENESPKVKAQVARTSFDLDERTLLGTGELEHAEAPHVEDSVIVIE